MQSERLRAPCPPIALTVSIGVAVLEAGMVDAAALVAAADRALYRCKAAGRNCSMVNESVAPVLRKFA